MKTSVTTSDAQDLALRALALDHWRGYNIVDVSISQEMDTETYWTNLLHARKVKVLALLSLTVIFTVAAVVLGLTKSSRLARDVSVSLSCLSFVILLFVRFTHPANRHRLVVDEWVQIRRRLLTCNGNSFSALTHYILHGNMEEEKTYFQKCQSDVQRYQRNIRRKGKNVSSDTPVLVPDSYEILEGSTPPRRLKEL